MLCSTPFAGVTPPARFLPWDPYICPGDRCPANPFFGAGGWIIHWAAVAPNIDVWSVNAYPGANFTGMQFEALDQFVDRPLLISEAGIDAFNSYGTRRDPTPPIGASLSEGCWWSGTSVAGRCGLTVGRLPCCALRASLQSTQINESPRRVSHVPRAQRRRRSTSTARGPTSTPTATARTWQRQAPLYWALRTRGPKQSGP